MPVCRCVELRSQLPSTSLILFQVFNFAVAVGASFLVDYMGRRTLFIISNAGMLFAFILWSTSEGIFNTLHKTAAAKGKMFSDNRWMARSQIVVIPSHDPDYFHLLFLLRPRLYTHAGRIYVGDPAVQDPCSWFCGHGDYHSNYFYIQHSTIYRTLSCS